MNPLTPITSMPTAGTPPPEPRRRTGVLIAGVVVVLAGLVLAAVLWFSAGRRSDDAIRGLARAPIGCDTTLNIAEAGTYIIFVETTGTLDDVDGDCSATGDFSRSGPPPDVVVELRDADGNELDLDDETGIEYDGAGSVGESIHSVQIDEAGPHVLRVESPENGVAVAVGRDPAAGVGLLRALAAISAIVGLLVGGLMLILGSRRDDMVAAPTSPQWPASTPMSPPGMPVAPGQSEWQPASGPPTALRPPTRGADAPAAFPAPDAPPRRPATSSDESPWAPPSE